MNERIVIDLEICHAKTMIHGKRGSLAGGIALKKFSANKATFSDWEKAKITIPGIPKGFDQTAAKQ